MPVTILHNPKCGTSRNTLALIRHFGFDPTIVEYLASPPSRAELEDLIAEGGLAVRDVVRKKGSPYAELGLAQASDAELLDAMVAHPILINRPIVASDNGVALCRPSDVVLDVLPEQPGNDAFKEDGAPFLRDRAIDGNDPALNAALKAADLPTDDLNEAGRHFFAYSTLAGTPVGFAGYELCGEDALLRSVVVLPEARGHKAGRNLVPLLAYRALREGARTAWLLTLHASAFFEALGYTRKTRAEAPAAILATRQAASLCPASAVVMAKSLGF